MRPAARIRSEVSVAAALHLTVRHVFRLGYKADDVHTESVYALIAPPGHHVEDLIPHLRVVPVEVRLLLREEVQIVLVRSLIVFPCGSAETRSPVGRLSAVLRVAPDVIVAVRVVLRLTALYEPCMLVRCVVDNKVHDYPDASPVSLIKKSVKVLHRTELVHDVHVIRYVVAVVIIRRLIHR